MFTHVSCCLKIVSFVEKLKKVSTIFVHVMKVSGVHYFQAPKRVNAGLNFDLSVRKLGIYQWSIVFASCYLYLCFMDLERRLEIGFLNI